MNQVFFFRLLRMIILLAVQVLILNNIHLMNYITPLLIGYMIVCLHHGTSRIAALMWGFVTGVLFDMFSNTAGMAAASCTLIAMVQPPLLNMFVPRDAPEHFVPSFRTIGFFSYIFYTFVLMLLLHSAFYLLDAFTLRDWTLTAYSVGGGTALSTLLCIMTDMLIGRENKVRSNGKKKKK